MDSSKATPLAVRGRLFGKETTAGTAYEAAGSDTDQDDIDDVITEAEQAGQEPKVKEMLEVGSKSCLNHRLDLPCARAQLQSIAKHLQGEALKVAVLFTLSSSHKCLLLQAKTQDCPHQG